MTYENILYSVSDRIARITLNIPEKLNPLTFGLRRDLVDALRAAERDDDVSVVLIEGAGTSFSSGYNLSIDEGDLRPAEWIESAQYQQWTDQFARSCYRDWMTIWDLLKPVVAKVHGYCMAGGTELMSICDIAFVADDAILGYPPMRGMSSPDVPYFPWKMSMANAKYLQLTGNSVTGEEAVRMGWVAKSFPADELEECVMRELRPMSKIASDLLAANKGCLNQAYELMGMRAAFSNAWQWHVLSSQFRPGAQDFLKAATEGGGVRAALEWQNGPFRDEGFRL